MVNIRNCTFVENEPGQRTDASGTILQHILILLLGKGNILSVEDTLFHRNDYSEIGPVRSLNADLTNIMVSNLKVLLAGQRSHSMIRSLDADLFLRRNCFVDNNLVGHGVVEAYTGTRVDSEGNFRSFEQGLTCSFLAKSIVNPTSESDIECLGYESQTCSIPGAPVDETVLVTLPPSPSMQSESTTSDAPCLSAALVFVALMIGHVVAQI